MNFLKVPQSELSERALLESALSGPVNVNHELVGLGGNWEDHMTYFSIYYQFKGNHAQLNQRD